jgi:hypothetical protein
VRAGGNLESLKNRWIPACAGMTVKKYTANADFISRQKRALSQTCNTDIKTRNDKTFVGQQ